MSLDIEQRARAVFERVADLLDDTLPAKADAEAAILAFAREVERGAVERAAKVADEYTSFAPVCEYGNGYITAGANIAAAIRSLTGADAAETGERK